MIRKLSQEVKRLRNSGQKTIILRKDRFGRSVLSLNILKNTGTAEQHDMTTDIMYIISGNGFIEVEGDIENKTLRSLHEWRGSKLLNPEKIQIGKGDIFTIDNSIPHRLFPKKQLIYLVYKQYCCDYMDLGKLPIDLKEKIKKIKGIIMDVDGVMTDGKVWVNEQGQELVSFSRIDSMGRKKIQKRGIKIGIISHEKVTIAKNRAKKLRIDCFTGIVDKVSQANQLIKKWGLKYEDICFVGDDINDIDLLKKVGFSTCPNDASYEVLKIVDLVLSKKRGDHVLRELFDLVDAIQDSN